MAEGKHFRILQNEQKQPSSYEFSRLHIINVYERQRRLMYSSVKWSMKSLFNYNSRIFVYA